MVVRQGLEEEFQLQFTIQQEINTVAVLLHLRMTFQWPVGLGICVHTSM